MKVKVEVFPCGQGPARVGVEMNTVRFGAGERVDVVVLMFIWAA